MRGEIIIKVEIDSACGFCNGNLARIKNNDVKPHEVICITPDTNSAGVETHRHIQIIDTTIEEQAHLTMEEMV